MNIQALYTATRHCSNTNTSHLVCRLLVYGTNTTKLQNFICKQNFPGFIV